jgi:hypothetical protein
MLINQVNPNEKTRFFNPLKKLHDFMEYNKRFPLYPAFDSDGIPCFCINKKGKQKVINGSKEFIGEFGGIKNAFNEIKRVYSYYANSEKLIEIMEEK